MADPAPLPRVERSVPQIGKGIPHLGRRSPPATGGRPAIRRNPCAAAASQGGDETPLLAEILNDDGGPEGVRLRPSDASLKALQARDLAGVKEHMV